MRIPFLLEAVLITLVAGPVIAQPDAPASRHLSRAVLRDKIRGGWAAKMAGAAYGTPDEFRAQGKIMDFTPSWKPDQAAMSINNDDLYVQMTLAAVLDQVGLDATCAQFGEAFRVSRYGLWHANAGARRNLNRGIPAPWSGHPKYNAHADDIDFQIEADFIGFMCPGLPRVANEYCDRVGHVMNYGDGVYGGMWLCGMYSAAFFESDVRKVIEAGLACIPAQSQYAALIRDVLTWSNQYPDNWTNCWKALEEKWDKDDVCPDGALAPFNIDAKFNGGYIALGLLYGRGDLGRTIEIATRAGQDSDCNPGNAAGVVGVILGYDRIPEKWKSGLPQVGDTKFLYTDYTLNQVIQATEAHALELIKRAGGQVTDTEVVIPFQSPLAPKLEQWNPGVPYKKLDINDPAWSWQGDWTKYDGAMTTVASGSETTLRFDGVAVVIAGLLDQAGGKADVFLDGKKSDYLLDAFIVKDTHDNTLWNTYGLEPREHTLRIVTRGDADPRSHGHKISIQRAVIYRAP
ncbi:MAG: ADP-ribosylglycohydrolase family protein [Candidatus Omnitrophica bacterium]|nr:ADP-ribosylglycohydrolase family protein [Candidatus Omnitrophota bacterium]